MGKNVGDRGYEPVFNIAVVPIPSFCKAVNCRDLDNVGKG